MPRMAAPAERKIATAVSVDGDATRRLSHWLASSVCVLGLFLGIGPIIAGVGWIRLGMDL